MSIETRTTEIMGSIKSASKETYHKSEVLPELLSLQQEIVAHTFKAEHTDLNALRIWDVENRLEQINESCGGVATEDLVRFKSGCRLMCNMIKAEYSGNRGKKSVPRPGQDAIQACNTQKC